MLLLDGADDVLFGVIFVMVTDSLQLSLDFYRQVFNFCDARPVIGVVGRLLSLISEEMEAFDIHLEGGSAIRYVHAVHVLDLIERFLFCLLNLLVGSGVCILG